MAGRRALPPAKMLTSVHFSGYYMRCYIPESSGVKLVNNRKNATEDTEDVAAFKQTAALNNWTVSRSYAESYKINYVSV